MTIAVVQRLLNILSPPPICNTHPAIDRKSPVSDRPVQTRRSLQKTASTNASPARLKRDGDVSTSVNKPATRAEKRELGVELLAHLEHEELSLSDAIDRIETVTASPTLTREILDTAEKRGVIERENARLRVRRGGTYVNYDSQVVQRDGEFDCRRCGATITTGHFVQLDAGELGPFGSSCIRKVTGRDDDAS